MLTHCALCIEMTAVAVTCREITLYLGLQLEHSVTSDLHVAYCGKAVQTSAFFKPTECHR